MAGIIQHVFRSGIPDGTDATQVQPQRDWNNQEQLIGGNHGSIVVRDTTDATYGSNYIQSVASGQVLTSTGSATMPAWSASPTLTGLTLSGLTSGSVVIAGTSGVLTQDNAGLFYDASGHKLWIGNAGAPTGWPTAAALLNVTATGNVSFTVASSGGSGNTNLNLYTYGSGTNNIITVQGGGTLAAITPSIAFATLGQWEAGGYTTSAALAVGAKFQFTTGELWAVGSQGTQATLSTTLNTTTALISRQQWDGLGNILFYPRGGPGAAVPSGYMQFYQTLNGGTSYIQSVVANYALTGAGPATANYYNPTYRYYVTDASGNTASLFEMACEGNWTSAGGFTGVANGWNLYDLRAGKYCILVGYNIGGVASPTNVSIGTTGAPFTLSVTGAINLVGNVGTDGAYGVPAIVSAPSSTRFTAQTAAKQSISYAVTGGDASFLVSANVNVTASTTHSFTVTCTYTDETNTSRTLTLNFSQITGTLLTTITNVQGVGAYEGVPLHIRVKTGTSIVIASVGTFTSVTYNIESAIQKLSL